MRLLALAVVLSGCVAPASMSGDVTQSVAPMVALDFEPKTNQGWATYEAWKFIGGVGDVPPIGWRPADPECGVSGWVLPGKGCIDGLTHVDTGIIELVWFGRFTDEHQPDPQTSGGGSGLVHELCHMRDLRLTGEPDVDHSGECFTANGLVNAGNDHLKDLSFY